MLFLSILNIRETHNISHLHWKQQICIILNFGYSLLDEEGKLMKFKENEDKIPVLNFSIQVLVEMLKVKNNLFASRTN